jgi:hypothetical protein
MRSTVNDCDMAINVSTYCAFPILSFAALSSATFVRGNSMQEPPHHDIMSSIVIYFIYRQAVNAPYGNFTVQRFFEVSYILRTHGPISSLASFFASECVRLKYALRGAFLLHADTMAPADEFSKIHLNEQRFSALTNLQSMTRLASTCVENCQQTQIEWVDSALISSSVVSEVLANSLTLAFMWPP